MAAKIGRIAWNCHHVPCAPGNRLVAAGAYVILRGLIWLNIANFNWAVQAVPKTHSYPKKAHTTSAIAVATAATTKTMSVFRFTCFLVGSKPMPLSIVVCMETVEVSRQGRIFTVTLNRPERKNAINGTMWRELGEVFVQLRQEREAWVVILTGAGENFSSGGDLTGGGMGTREQAMQRITDLVVAIHRLPMPTIAKVRGYCIGGGMGVAMACDLIVAADTARFTQNFAVRGMSLDSGSSFSLPRRVPMHRAKELALLAEFVDGATAGEMGLVNRSLPEAELDSFVDAWAQRIASLPPAAIQNNKRLLNNSLGISMEQALEDEATAQYQNWSTKDFAEAMKAFVEKRTPNFEGR